MSESLSAADYRVETVPLHGEADALIRTLHYSRSCPNTSTYRHGLYAANDGFFAPLRGVAEVDTEHGYYAGLTDALRRLRDGRRGPATDADRPPVSLFPMTRAARAALRYTRESGR